MDALTGPACQCRVKIVSNRAQLRLTPVLERLMPACKAMGAQMADRLHSELYFVVLKLTRCANAGYSHHTIGVQ